MLCAICISVFEGPAKQGNHHASFGNLVKAANSGCKICKYLCRFREDLGPDEAGELHSDPFTRFRYGKYDDEEAPFINFMADVSWLEHDLPWKHLYLHVSDPKATPEWWSQFLEVARKDLHTEPWHVRNDKFPKRSIPVNTGDAEVLQLAFDWLKACKSNHDRCRKIDKDADCKYYPGRLLDIADMDTQVCRLLVTENGNLTDGSGYVALSHCWGKNPSFLTLTSRNMNDLQRGIPLYRLPKTFVDSLHICRQLGFRYLWIDSLCIMQSGPGAEEDWQAHAATMDSIYANCELNLAVSCAANAEQGAFVDRDPEFLQTAFVYVPITMNLLGVTEAPLPDEKDFNDAAAIDPPAENQQLTIEDESSSPESTSSLVTIFAAWYDFQSALWSLPLQKRGWVIQERLMAPRALYFGRDRIYWECKERVQNEYLPWGIPGSGIMFDGHYQRAFNLPDSIFEPRLNPSTYEDIASMHRAWYSVVNDYSATDLTYPNKDKFVAIAAIAKKFNCVLNSQYIAGLFCSDLPIGLLWQQSKLVCFPRDCEGNGWGNGWREKVFLDSQRDYAYRAPSWYVQASTKYKNYA
ncbi:heterokaryon incompatibility protein [Rutstroemia sp. NJR-2017a BVV2]|nr:heterokaryon incompatibility protein [Rutstroemia sp. NJR-2017a BVV2]